MCNCPCRCFTLWLQEVELVRHQDMGQPHVQIRHWLRECSCSPCVQGTRRCWLPAGLQHSRCVAQQQQQASPAQWTRARNVRACEQPRTTKHAYIRCFLQAWWSLLAVILRCVPCRAVPCLRRGCHLWAATCWASGWGSSCCEAPAGIAVKVLETACEETGLCSTQGSADADLKRFCRDIVSDGNTMLSMHSTSR